MIRESHRSHDTYGLVIVTGTIPLVPGGGLCSAASRAWMSQYNLSFRLKYPWFLSDDPQVAHLKQSAWRFLSLMRTNTPLEVGCVFVGEWRVVGDP